MTDLHKIPQQSLEALDEAATFHRNLPDQHARRLAAMTAPRAALAEPVQEPVAWADRIAFESAMNNGKGCDVWPNAGDYVARTGRALIRLYTAPPRYKHMPLPEEAISYLCDEHPNPQQLARAVERAHGIKE